MDTFNGHRQFLQEAHAYPLTNFPGHTQENLLGQLLRKKLEPGVEDWVDVHTTKVDDAPVNGLGRDEMKELWNWAAPASAGIVGPMLEEGGEFEDDFTIAEREAGVETVVTGLERRLDGDEEEDEGDEDDEYDEEGDKMEDVMPSVKKDDGEKGIDPTLPAMPVDSVLRFTTTGVIPGNTRPNRQ